MSSPTITGEERGTANSAFLNDCNASKLADLETLRPALTLNFSLHAKMKHLLRDPRVTRLLLANTVGSVGSGVTIFAVPWLMVHRASGNDVFRWTTLLTTLVLFLIMPHYGALIDRHSRKTMLLASEVFGCAATLSMALTALLSGRVEMWQLVTSYFCGMLYYTLHYPAKFAFIQQIFDRTHYQSLIGLLEIQGQTAMMIAGGLGGYLLDRGVPLWTILSLDAATYAASFLIQSTLPYHATHLENVSKEARQTSVWRSVGEGWRWLHERPQLAWFLTCSLMPFVAVMSANYLFPIYISQTLHRDARVFGSGEISFAIGAMIAGGLMPRLIARHTAYPTIAATMLIFIVGLAVVIFLPFTSAYLAASVTLGFGNAGCRVARSALMLHIIPNHMMGRVNIFYNVFDRLMRSLIVAALSIIDLLGPRSGFVLLLLLVATAYVVLAKTRDGVPAIEAIEATA